MDLDNEELKATKELMKSANEMFKELGYTQKNPYTDEIEIIYRHYATANTIRFWKNTQAVIKQTEDGWSMPINMQELQAINKKVLELRVVRMKIIDLLNKIANGEEIPKKIRIQGEYIFELSKDFEHYYYNENLEITDLLNHNFSNLNDEVEIIEENKKIEKLYHCCMESDNSQISILVANINMLSDKINELIDKVNEGEIKYE